jgi:hypothetical protein
MQGFSGKRRVICRDFQRRGDILVCNESLSLTTTTIEGNPGRDEALFPNFM